MMTLLIPLVEPMDREGVAEIMDARTSAAGLGDAGAHQNITEVFFDGLLLVSACGLAEERGSVVAGGVDFLPDRIVCSQFLRGHRRKRDQTFFMELGLPQGECIFFKI